MSGEYVDVHRYWPLCKCIQERKWKDVDDFISKNPEALTATITKDSETVFHRIVNFDCPAWLMKKLASGIKHCQEVLGKVDSNGDTALSNAAIAGNKEAAKILVEANNELLFIENDELCLPVHLAAMYGHKKTVQYLLSVSEKGSTDEDMPFAGNRGSLLITLLIKSNLYGVARDLLKRHPNLARDEISCREAVLETLARKPQGFASGSRPVIWQRLIYHCVPVKNEHSPSSQTKKDDIPPVESKDGDTENPIEGSVHYSRESIIFEVLQQIASAFGVFRRKLHIKLWDNLMRLVPCFKRIHDTKLMHIQTLEIVRMMCEGTSWSFEEAFDHLGKPIRVAARLGIHEFVDEIMKTYIYSYGLQDQKGNSVFMIAVSHRREKVLRLINRIDMLKVQATTLFIDECGNNILHLAGRLGPSPHDVPGAALQMQRELQWFKAVEKLVHPSLHEQKNVSKKTPREVFTDAHKDLVEKGEKWMKETASSCTVVAALIITVVFTAAFTVPGGNTSTGIPIFLHEPAFMIFAVSDAFALFFSATSVLMFLGILTSRYSEEDFLESLPRKLIIGLITLFLSIASMMIAFGAAIYIVLFGLWSPVFIPIAVLGGLTVILFAELQFPLLIEMYFSTYWSSIFQSLK